MRSQRYQLDKQLLFEVSTNAVASGNGTARQINNKEGRSDIAQMIISIEAIKAAPVGDENYVFIMQQADDLAFTLNVEYVGALQVVPNQVIKHAQIAQNIGPITKDFIRPAWILTGTLPDMTFSLYLGGA